MMSSYLFSALPLHKHIFLDEIPALPLAGDARMHYKQSLHNQLFTVTPLISIH